MDGLEAERDRLREAVIVALAALKNGHPTEARTVLASALDGTGLDDGRESARIIARQYRQLNPAGQYDNTPTTEPMTEKQRDDADELYDYGSVERARKEHEEEGE